MRRLPALAGALIGAVIAGARAEQPASPIDASVPPSVATANVVPPAQVDHAIAALPGFARAIMDKTRIPGMAISVVRDGRPVYEAGFGIRRVGADAKVDADTVFQLASLSKSLAGTVVARQVGLGLVTWDMPIVKTMPSFALADDWVSRHVTVADMFSHRSGLPSHAGDELEDFGFNQADVLHRLRLLKLGPFRAQYAYTNFGFTAAAEAVAAASGKDWAGLSEDALYKPLGMASTSSRHAEFIARANRVANHVRVDGAYQAKLQRQPTAQTPAGGASSSVHDMARWMSLVLQGGVFEGRRIVAAEALLPAMTAQAISDSGSTRESRPSTYGYGFGVGVLPSGRVAIQHSGAFSLGASTTYILVPSLGLGITVLSNAAPVGAVEALANEFVDLVQFGAVTRDWLADYGKLIAPMMAPFGSLVGKSPPPHAAPALAPAAYAGTYGNAYYGELTVAQRGDALVLALGPVGTSFVLRHWDGNDFAFSLENEDASPGSISRVSFEADAAGKAGAVMVELCQESGWGRFERR